MLLAELFEDDLDEALSDRAKRVIGAGLMGAGLLSGGAGMMGHWGGKHRPAVSADHPQYLSRPADGSVRLPEPEQTRLPPESTPLWAPDTADDDPEDEPAPPAIMVAPHRQGEGPSFRDAERSSEPAVAPVTEPAPNDDTPVVVPPGRKPQADAASPSSHSGYPRELQDLEGEDLKRRFTEIMVPLIHQENGKILKLRQQVIRLSQKPHLGGQERAFLDSLMKTYRVEDGDIETLIGRLDIVPPSLVLAQSATESGWGTSPLAQRGNVLFGQKSFTDDPKAKVVKARKDGTPYSAFGSFADSIESYMRNINSHPAYKDLRKVRNYFRKKGRPPQGIDLVDHLSQYSTKRGAYVDMIKDMIRDQGWDRLDKAESR